MLGLNYDFLVTMYAFYLFSMTVLPRGDTASSLEDTDTCVDISDIDTL